MASLMIRLSRPPGTTFTDSPASLVSRHSETGPRGSARREDGSA
jgi:hypothetical protein